MKNPKILAIPMVLMLGLLSTGVAYACWSDTILINGSVASGTLCAKFVEPVTTTDHGNDWTCNMPDIPEPGDVFQNVRQLTKDVGSSSARILDGGCPDTIEVILNNVYPCYYEHIAFWVYNCGTTPWRIQSVVFKTASGDTTIYHSGYLQLDLNNDGYNDVELYWGNNFGDQVDKNQKVDISFEIHVLQKAPQSASLRFQVQINVVQWNMYVPPIKG